MVLDLLIEAWPFVIVDDFDMPAGLVIVLDFVVVVVAGACVVWVDIFDVLLLIFEVEVAAGAVVGVAVWAWAAPPNKLRETRKPIMRFIKKKNEG